MHKTETININMSYSDFQQTIKGIIKEEIAQMLQKIDEQKKTPPDWEELTLAEAAIELNCHKRTIRSKMKQLNITGMRVGKKITLQRKDLKKMRKAQQNLDQEKSF
jgi:excisionase family DNA binding protein